MFDDYEPMERPLPPCCSKCGKETWELEERYSMGIYAGRYCSDECWRNSGYRDVDASEFDPDYAGERYDDDY